MRCLSEKEREASADGFAAAFLVPGNAARLELGSHRSAVAPSGLGYLKKKYGMSMQAWIRRARELNILARSTADAMLSTAKKAGWEVQEPISLEFEEPHRMVRLALRAWSEGVISESRAVELTSCSRDHFRRMRSGAPPAPA